MEHAYQALKTFNKFEHDAILNADSPRKARNLGQEVTMRRDWNQVKFDMMKLCVKAKFLQHDDLREKLFETGEEELVEDSPVDFYWGCGSDGTGLNKLGIVLMEVRKELRELE